MIVWVGVVKAVTPNAQPGKQLQAAVGPHAYKTQMYKTAT